MQYVKSLEDITQKIERIFLEKSPFTWIHSLNVSRIAMIIAENFDLNKENLEAVRIGGLLHDVGKIYIPSEILNKPSKLTEEEFLIIKEHPILGIREFEGIIFSPDIIKILHIFLYHHERYDGNGYPYRLKGEDIPFLTRIVSVADAIDAICGSRPYKEGLPIEAVIKELEKAKWLQLDPHIVEVALSNIDKIIEGYNTKTPLNADVLISSVG